jgi:hypothetical protein
MAVEIVHLIAEVMQAASPVEETLNGRIVAGRFHELNNTRRLLAGPKKRNADVLNRIGEDHAVPLCGKRLKESPHPAVDAVHYESDMVKHHESGTRFE